MTFTLPSLPFKKDELKPYLSEETIDYHYGKHHQTYVTNLNKLIIGTEFEHQILTDIIKNAKGAIFNNAAQHFNHSFYWNSLTSKSNLKLAKDLLATINQTFGNIDKFKEEFTKSGLSLFGSGWTWLVKNNKNQLSIINTSNAGNPIGDNLTPLLTCDVWEHAYYIDYRNNRGKYLENFWNIINWEFVSNNFSK